MSSPKPRVVIIGLGWAGVEALKGLANSKQFRVTVVAEKSYFMNSVASLRSAVDGDVSRNLLSTDKVLALPDVTYVHDRAVEIRSTFVALQNGSTLDFDYLIIATGSKFSFPANASSLDAQQAAEEYKQLAQQIKQAQHVVLVGGGAVGVQLAGEINDEYKTKKITLIDGGARLLSSNHAISHKVSDRLLAQFEKRGVQVLLNDRTTQPAMPSDGKPLVGSQTVTTNGKQFTADLIFFTTGGSPNSQLVSDSPEFQGKDVLNAGRYVKVDEYQAVQGYKNIFAIGDVSSFQPGQSFWAGDQGSTVAKHLIKIAAGKSGQKVKKGMNALLVPLDKTGGAGEMPLPIGGVAVGSYFTPTLKGASLFVPQTKKQLLLAA